MHESESNVGSHYQISENDLEELECITEQILRARDMNRTDSLFALYQRLKHIAARTRGIFEDY